MDLTILLWKPYLGRTLL